MSSLDSQSYIVSKWSLSKGRIQNGPNNLAFIKDPFPTPSASSSNETGPVLEVTYPQGSFSHDTGGTQLYSLWNSSDGNAFRSMLVTYEVAFDSNFNWVKGGKLPGLKGGPVVDGCDGGKKTNGTDCFTTRRMWRKNANGEGMLHGIRLLRLFIY